MLRGLPIPLPWPQAVTSEELSPGATEDGTGAVQRAGSFPYPPPTPSPPPWQDRLGQPSTRDWTLSLSRRPPSLTALLPFLKVGRGRVGQWGGGSGTPPSSSHRATEGRPGGGRNETARVSGRPCHHSPDPRHPPCATDPVGPAQGH